ncbi:MAG: flagellar protein FlgN [Gammaproteobacteria bacterium]|nr:flagellar protein FlgN [Gammaproteobacteria bacterium]
MLLSTHHQLREQMRQEVDCLDCLQDILTQEYEHLKSRRVEALESLARDKQQLIIQLEQFSQQTAQLLQQTGATADKAGLEDFLSSMEKSLREVMLDEWEQMHEKLFECQQQNQLNGMIIEGKQRNATQALAILTGRQVPQNELYNQKGASESPLDARALAEA